MNCHCLCYSEHARITENIECVRLASLGRPRCVAGFFSGRTLVIIYTRSSCEKNVTHRCRPREAKRTHPIWILTGKSAATKRPESPLLCNIPFRYIKFVLCRPYLEPFVVRVQILQCRTNAQLPVNYVFQVGDGCFMIES